jgi:alkanesulfonate monooxygenase SsuD/methylene tetrahydromethanopterin reductase-like flavin-dependent oxidoreductase (luciferase family)
MARAAEAAGFDSIWLSDHLLYRANGAERGPWEAWTMLAALAAATERVIGSNGPRMLAATLPHVDAWNTWYEDYGNSPDGFANLGARITAAARGAGRDPDQIERSACMLVAVGGSSGEPASTPDAPPPVAGSPDEIASALSDLHEAGADEIILVVDPITERSISELGEAVGLLRG